MSLDNLLKLNNESVLRRINLYQEIRAFQYINNLQNDYSYDTIESVKALIQNQAMKSYKLSKVDFDELENFMSELRTENLYKVDMLFKERFEK